MFCPEGYIAFAELWTQFAAKRFRGIYLSALQSYASSKFNAAFIRGSPLDICEHVFLKSLCDHGFCAASPTGEIVKLHMPIGVGGATLGDVVDPFRSAYWQAAAKIDESIGDQFEVMAGPRFLPWGPDASDGSAWSAKYNQAAIETRGDPADFWGICFRSVPVGIERESFTIAKALLRWAGRARKTRALGAIIEHFGGWSLCIPEAKRADWVPYLEGKPVCADV